MDAVAQPKIFYLEDDEGHIRSTLELARKNELPIEHFPRPLKFLEGIEELHRNHSLPEKLIVLSDGEMGSTEGFLGTLSVIDYLFQIKPNIRVKLGLQTAALNVNPKDNNVWMDLSAWTKLITEGLYPALVGQDKNHQNALRNLFKRPRDFFNSCIACGVDRTALAQYSALNLFAVFKKNLETNGCLDWLKDNG